MIIHTLQTIFALVIVTGRIEIKHHNAPITPGAIQAIQRRHTLTRIVTMALWGSLALILALSAYMLVDMARLAYASDCEPGDQPYTANGLTICVSAEDASTLGANPKPSEMIKAMRQPHTEPASPRAWSRADMSADDLIAEAKANYRNSPEYQQGSALLADLQPAVTLGTTLTLNRETFGTTAKAKPSKPAKAPAVKASKTTINVKVTIKAPAKPKPAKVKVTCSNRITRTAKGTVTTKHECSRSVG